MAENRLAAAIDRMRIARKYTESFLADLQPDDWFWQPSEGVTHIAWQAGHIAAAQYALCLLRVRGASEADERLISAADRKAFGRDSLPAPADQSPPVEHILAVLRGVHEQALQELAECDQQQLDVRLPAPHPMFDTKLGAVEWSSQHELVHAGQIAMLRRLMGKKPLR